MGNNKGLAEEFGAGPTLVRASKGGGTAWLGRPLVVELSCES